MMNITKENNFSETAFTVKEGDHYRLRWFTPGGEIDLCGHATLGTSFVLANYVEPGTKKFVFDTMKNQLVVTEKDGLYTMDFPAYDLKPVEVTDAMADACGARPKEAYMGRDLLLVFDDEETVRNMQPDQEKLKGLDGLLTHVTAPGKDYDCVSRSFAPKLNVAEDPVCGSGHCHIVPYWVKRLGKADIVAFQASKRTGVLYCTQEGDTIHMSGYATLYSQAELNI